MSTANLSAEYFWGGAGLAATVAFGISDINSIAYTSWMGDGAINTNGQAVNTFGNLDVPTGFTAGTATAGGSFAANTYYWVITSVNPAGETTQSLQVTKAVTLNQEVPLSWTRMPGATGYKIYRSTTSGTYGATSLVHTITNGATTSYTDTGSATTTGTPPTTPTGSKFVVQGWNAQTANLQEWQNAAGSAVASVGPTGTVTGTVVAVAGGFVGSITANTLSAARAYILPDAAGTFGLLPATQTWTGANTWMNYVGTFAAGLIAVDTEISAASNSVTALTVGPFSSSQTAALQTWLDINNVVLSQIAADGSVTFNGQAVNTYGNLAVPSSFAAGAATSGGAFAANTYYWVMTATNAAGETIAATQVTKVVTLNQEVPLTWAQVPGATGYKIYRSTSSGLYGATSLVTTITNGATIAYTDTGTATTTGTPPTAPTGSNLLLRAWSSQAGQLLTIENAGGQKIGGLSAGGVPQGSLGALRNYIEGLILSNGGLTVVDIAAGSCTDSTQASLMTLGAVTKSIAANWAVGSGNGGLDTGSVAPSTWYHVFVIARQDTGVVDALISASATAPTMPTNYTLFRRIGSILANASSQLANFTQYPGGVFKWTTATTDLSTASPATTATTLTVTVPLGVVVQALNYTISTPATTAGTTRTFDFVSGQPGLYAWGAIAGGGSGGTNAAWTNLLSQIKYSSTIVGATVIIITVGWIDSRGHDS